MTAIGSPSSSADRGSILPIVLVVAVVLSVVVVALAKYVTADLAFARVAEARAESQASATGAIAYGVERVRLGRTLCSNPAQSFESVTPGILNSNGTTTTLSCVRLSPGGTGMTGWSLILTGTGGDVLHVERGNPVIEGSVFIDDVDDIDIDSGIARHVDGDLWHGPSCSDSVPAAYDFEPADSRGPLCTNTTWSAIMAAPDLPPGLASLPPATTPVDVSGCRVFSPGRYDDPIDFGPGDAFFKSGTYWFDDVGRIEVAGVGLDVWFGKGPAPPLVSNDACSSVAAYLADDVSGAVAYMSGDSRFRVFDEGSIEFFSRIVGGSQVSVQQYGAVGGLAIVGVGNPEPNFSDPPADAVIHGLVYTPSAPLRFNNTHADSWQQSLGGAVVSQLLVAPENDADHFRISPSRTPSFAKLALRATSSTSDGTTATVRAVVDYRPDLALAGRVAVNSIRVID